MNLRQQNRSNLIKLLEEEKVDLNNKFDAVNSLLGIMEPKKAKLHSEPSGEELKDKEMTGQQKEIDFHNTINETGERLTELKRKTQTQQEMILKYFYQNSIYCFTPFEIQEAILPSTPITSIRRAMTNLTTQGHLIKEVMQKIEKYGVKNNVWSFNANGPHGNKYKE